MLSKALVYLASRFRIRKRNEPVRSLRSMSRLRACWAVREPAGCAVTPRMCTCRVATSISNSTYRRFEEDRARVEEVTGQQSFCLSAQERPPGGVLIPRSRPAPSAAQDPAHRRFADEVPEPGQLAVHPAVPPARVLARQPQRHVADLLAGPRPAWWVRVRPLAFDQAPVPGQ